MTLSRETNNCRKIFSSCISDFRKRPVLQHEKKKTILLSVVLLSVELIDLQHNHSKNTNNFVY